MIFPSIEQLTKNGFYNRYELVIAVAKAARVITDIQIAKKEESEKNIPSKEFTDKNSIKSDINDEKAVRIAIQKLYNSDFLIKNN